MKKPKAARGLSDNELAAMIESLPDGLALFDATGALTWANRRGRRLLALHATETPAVGVGSELESLIARLIGALTPVRRDEYARWAVSEGGTVDVALRFWGAQVVARLTAPPQLARDEIPGRAREIAPFQLIILERVLDEADIGLAVATERGRIRWMNQQAKRLFGSARRQQHDAERDIVRAARHVAAGELAASIRLTLQLPTRAVDAQFWAAAPGLAGVRFDDSEEMVWQEESLIA